MDTDYEKDFFDNIIDNVIAIDKEGLIREVNKATLKILGYKKKEEIITLPFEKICKNFSTTGFKDKLPLADQELIYLNKEGKEIPVSVNIITRISYPDDIIFMGRGISKIKDLISDLTQSQKELKASYEQLQAGKDDLVRSEKLAYTGRIAAGIAHEIRNPLANVSMSVQQIKKVLSLKEQESKHIEIVERNIERINYLITELLNCARPTKLNLQPYDIHKVIKDVLESNNTKISLQRIKVTEDLTSKPSTLKIDKEQIERAFLNLITNAIEAMLRGGNLTIITELNGNFFQVKIHNTGKGIPEKNIIKIFDPFFSTKPQGVGLGLSICYGIIVSHEGIIEVESKSKIGSTFTVSLPTEQRLTHRE